MVAPALAAIPAIISAITAASAATAQGIAAGVEADRPENRLDERAWLQRQGLTEAEREAERRVRGSTGAAIRGARHSLGPKAQYLLGGPGAGAGGESMLPDFRRLMSNARLREQQRLGAVRGGMLEERGGLQAASGKRLGILSNVLGTVNKAVGSEAQSESAGTALENIPFGEIMGGISGGIGMGSQAGLGEQRRRGGRQFSDQPLFGGSDYGLYGGGY